MSKSSKHHYLPQFYIKGFTNNEKQLYIYNKKKDTISQRPIAPGGIFYELDANTIELHGEVSYELEDVYYRDIDNKFSKTIEIFRNEKNAETLFIEENKIAISLFFISIFWRIPTTRYLINNLVQNADLTFTSKNTSLFLNLIENKNYKKDPSFLKVAKAALLFESVYKLSGPPKETAYYRITDFPEKTLLLGDYPMLYSEFPKSFNDLYYADHIFPVSATRIITRTTRELKPMSIESQIPINLAIINQSSTYIASASLKFLTMMIEYYKGLKVLGKLNTELEKVFDYMK
ncbi:DUF4238 domain-containing protein [Spirosoma jeollabukense]